MTTHAPDEGANNALRRQIAELDRKSAALVTAVESGDEIPALSQQLSRRSREREALLARLRLSPSPARPTKEEVVAAIGELGGVAAVLTTADPQDKAKLYLSLDIQLSYNHKSKLVTASAGAACAQQRVRRGT